MSLNTKFTLDDVFTVSFNSKTSKTASSEGLVTTSKEFLLFWTLKGSTEMVRVIGDGALVDYSTEQEAGILNDKEALKLLDIFKPIMSKKQYSNGLRAFGYV